MSSAWDVESGADGKTVWFEIGRTVEVVGDDVAGLIVHDTARAAALADAARYSRRALRARRSSHPLARANRGEHQLKGVPGAWLVNAVDAPTRYAPDDREGKVAFERLPQTPDAAFARPDGVASSFGNVDIPDVGFLRTERGTIAYQRFGEGNRTIVWTAPPHISIETRWSRPGDIARWKALASIGAVVIFDYRGVGVSERLPVDRVGVAEELCFDLGAVINGVATGPTVLVATGWATRIAVPYVVDQPGAVDRMILLNSVAQNPVRDVATIDEVLDRWGTGEILGRGTNVEVEPSQRWLAGHNERIVGTPEVAAALMAASLDMDVTALLGRVDVPTLVIHTGDVATVSPADSEAVASRIPNATFLLRPSSFFNWGDWGRDIQEFITGRRPTSAGTRDLAAVMFTDIVGSTSTASQRGDALWRDTLASLDQMVVRVAGEHRGRVVKQTGDGHLLEFARPGDAIAAACRLTDEVRMLGVDLRTGIHFGEVERRDDGDLGGIAVHLAARVAAEASAHEIVVSRTVGELTLGDGRTYTSRGAASLKGIPGKWELLSLHR